MTNPKPEIPNQKFPSDRGHLPTEQRLSASSDLDALSIEQTLELINAQDATVHEAVRRTIPALSRLVEAIVQRLRGGGRLIYLGAGTSGRLGVLDASECPPTFHCDPNQVIGIIAGGDGALRRSSEGAEDDPGGADAELTKLNVGSHDVVIGIAAGGTTPYVHGAIAIARTRGAFTGLITCVDAQPHAADVVVSLVTGPEVVTGSTRMKAGTATKLALNMISTTTMVQLGKVWGNLMVDLSASNVKLRDRACRIILSQCDVTRDQAMTLLDESQGRVKVALVMAKLKVDAGRARRLLDEHHGQLRPLLGAPH